MSTDHEQLIFCFNCPKTTNVVELDTAFGN